MARVFGLSSRSKTASSFAPNPTTIAFGTTRLATTAVISKIMLRRGWLFFLGVFVYLGTTNLRAHNAPGSALLLDFHTDQIDAELRLPISELELSFKEPLQAQPDSVVTRFRDPLAEY